MRKQRSDNMAYFVACRGVRRNVIWPPTKLNFPAVSQIFVPDSVTFAIQDLLTWRPAEVNFLVDLCSSQDGRLRVA
jgi:hypothetical protein